jgi:hypothetical protein
VCCLPLPDLQQIDLQIGKEGVCIEAGGGIDAPGFTTATGGPHLHHLLFGNQGCRWSCRTTSAATQMRERPSPAGSATCCCELQHGVGVGLADSLKLLGCEPQFIRQQQLRQGMLFTGRCLHHGKGIRRQLSRIKTYVFGGLSSASKTARASLSWSRLRKVSARRNRH